MIILDTNAVHDLDPNGSRADLIRALRRAGLKIGVPWVVLEELTAHKTHEYQRHFELMLRHYEKIQSLEPNLIGPEPEFKIDEFSKYWRRQYENVFDLIPTGIKALRASILREAACMRPAKIDPTKKSGGRDVAVWFSILEYLNDNPSENITFATNNTKDFGEPEDWPFPLNFDLGQNRERVKQISGFEDILQEFTEEAEPSETHETDLVHRLESPETRSQIATEARIHLGADRAKVKNRGRSSKSILNVFYKSMGPVEHRKVGNTAWSWAPVKWHVYLIKPDLGEPRFFSWDTSVLFPYRDNLPVSLLRSGKFSPLEEENTEKEVVREARQEMRIVHDELIMKNYRDPLLSESLTTGEQIPEEESLEELEELEIENHLARRTYEKSLLARRGYEYKKKVHRQLDQIRENVVLLDGPGDRGVNSAILTQNGIISVCIKYGESPLTTQDLIRFMERSQGMGEALLIVTNRPVPNRLRTHLRLFSETPSRPTEIARWRSPEDNELLISHILNIEQKLANRGN